MLIIRFSSCSRFLTHNSGNNLNYQMADTVKNIILIRPHSDIPKVIPIGLLYLSTFLLKKSRNTIFPQIIDFRLTQTFDRELLKNAINRSSPTLIGISALSLEIEEVLEIAQFIKKNYTSICLVLGGPLASAEYSFLYELNLFDHIVVGEGEEILFHLSNNSLPEKKTILFARDFSNIDVNYFPFPDYSLLNMENYFVMSSSEVFQINKRYGSIFTSRGCPFTCAFCFAFNVFGRKVRFRKIENIVEEVKYLVHTYQIKEIHIVDDIFNVDKKRVLAFFSEMRKHNLKPAISFPNGLKYDFIDEEVVQTLKKNNVYRVCLGIEQTSEKIMHLISKRHNLVKLNQCIELLDKYNLMVHGYFMTGFPTETIKDLYQTTSFILKSKLHTFRFSRYVPYNGTELYLRFFGNPEKSSIDSIKMSLHHSTNINYSDIPTKQVNNIIRLTSIKFYLNPLRIFRIFLATNKLIFFKKSFIAPIYIIAGKAKLHS